MRSDRISQKLGPRSDNTAVPGESREIWGGGSQRRPEVPLEAEPGAPGLAAVLSRCEARDTPQRWTCLRKQTGESSPPPE